MPAFKYWAFISYSHQDRAWGDWLHKSLEQYRVPSRLVGRESRDGKIPPRLLPIFRDRDELPSSADLGGVINEALAASRHQIVICSPRSAKSKWVDAEVRHFKSLGHDDRVLCLIVDGEPYAGDERECFAPAVRFKVTRAEEITSNPAEPIAADARDHADGKQGALLKLIAGLLGVGFDEIVQRERQRQFWRRVQMVAAAFAFAGVIAGVSQWFLHQRAGREREITIEKLVENGRQELLDGHQARAAVFLNEAYKMGYDTVPLRFMLHQALLPVEALTNVRVHHGGTQVYRSAFSPDDRQFVLIVTDDRGKTETAVAKIYDAATGAELMVLPDAPVLPIHVEFLPAVHRLLVSGYPDSNKSGTPFTQIWDLDGAHESVKLEGISGAAGIPMSADGHRVIASGKHGLHVFDTTSGAKLTTIAPGREIVAATYSKDGDLVAFADAQGNVDVRDGANVTSQFKLGSEQIAALTFAPDGQRLIGMTPWGDVRIWNLSNHSLEIAFAADPNWVSDLRFDRTGNRFVTVGSQGFRVWSTQRGAFLVFIPLGTNPYSSATLSPDGDTLLTADYLNSASEGWDIRSQRKLYTLDVHSGGVTSATFDSKGRRVLIASRDGSAEIWRMPVEPSWKYESFETLPYAARFSRDGKRVLVGGGDQEGRAMIFDLEKGAIVKEFAGHKGLVYEAAFSPDEDRVVTASRDGTLGLWEVASGKRLATMDQQPDEVYHASFSPDGSRIVTSESPIATATGNFAGLWHARSGERIAVLKHDDRVYAARFDAQSNVVVTAGGDARIKIWDAHSGALLRTLSGHTARVYAIDLSADGRRLVSVAHDNTARIWNTQSGTTEAVLENPAIGLPQAVRLSPDEQTVAIGTQEGTVWLWKPSTNALHALKGHRLEVDGLRFSADGKLLFTNAMDGIARAWDAVAGSDLGVVGAHETRINSLDFNSDKLLTASWSQLQLWDAANERRSPQEIAQLLSCAAPWSVQASRVALNRSALKDADCRR